jgi:uncharacterized protein (TIGR00251 family)
VSGRTTPQPAARVRFAVKVVPGAARDEIAGWLGDALKLRVRAAPERGKANAAALALLARVLELPPKSVRIVAGETSARKQVEIAGLSMLEVRERLDEKT